MMIHEALLHCRGIGPARLAQLHELGVRSWNDVLHQSSVLPVAVRSSLLDECEACLAAFARRDIGFFVNRLAAADRWRILTEFSGDATYFDIETSGLDYDATITTIVCWHRGELHTFVEHENLDQFLTLLDDVQLLVSFNGASFDVPRVLDAFHIPQLPCPHLDLRWLCHHQGLRGGLKRISHRLGIQRPRDLLFADGEMAVIWWSRWLHTQDRQARDLLVRYCAADVLLTLLVARRIGALHQANLLATRAGDVERMSPIELPDEELALWSQLPSLPSAAKVQNRASPMHRGPAAPHAAPPASLGDAALEHPARPFGTASPQLLRARRLRPRTP